jgi:hypothetical protein
MATTLGEIARVEGYRAQLVFNGKQVTVITATGNSTFTALVEEGAIIDPNMPLGEDLREVTLIHALRSEAPATLPRTSTARTPRCGSGYTA